MGERIGGRVRCPNGQRTVEGIWGGIGLWAFQGLWHLPLRVGMVRGENYKGEALVICNGLPLIFSAFLGSLLFFCAPKTGARPIFLRKAVPTGG
jgi:hypothetical protein